MELLKLKLVLVEWEDSCEAGGYWQGRDVGMEGLPCRSTGFLVSRDDHGVLLAQSENEGQYGGLFRIPKGAIKSVRKLR